MHPEVGAGHLQRAEDAFLEHFIERFARDGLDVAAQHVNGVAVLPAGAGVELERRFGQVLGKLLKSWCAPRLVVATGVKVCAFVARLAACSLFDVAVIQAAASGSSTCVG